MRSTDLTFFDILQLGRAAVAIRTFGRIPDSSCIGGSASQKDLGPREAFRVHVGLVTLWNRGQGKKYGWCHISLNMPLHVERTNGSPKLRWAGRACGQIRGFEEGGVCT